MSNIAKTATIAALGVLAAIFMGGIHYWITRFTSGAIFHDWAFGWQITYIVTMVICIVLFFCGAIMVLDEEPTEPYGYEYKDNS